MWSKWALVISGGFLVTSAANGFNEIIEKDLDRLMKRTGSPYAIRAYDNRAGLSNRLVYGHIWHLFIG
jgi:heme O synthase-like polyprenyltransferase